MAHSTRTPLRNQVESLARPFAQAPGLPFADVLTAGSAQAAFAAEGVAGIDCAYTPLTAVRLLLAQALDPGPSLRQAVSRLLAERAAAGQGPISAATGAYRPARSRLPEGVRARRARRVGGALPLQAPAAWRGKGRDVKAVDGTTVPMPDTAADQAAWPPPPHERPGLGFPLARLVAVFSPAVGTALDAALGPYTGTEAGETALFRPRHGCPHPGDRVRRDRCCCSYLEIALLRQRGVAVVLRRHPRRPVDCRRGRRLGKDDQVIAWKKPQRPAWLDEGTYAQRPATLAVRQVRRRGGQEGFRTKALVVATTRPQPRAASRRDRTDRYRMRWHADLDLRSLKDTMPMRILRGKTPALVRKETRAPVLA